MLVLTQEGAQVLWQWMLGIAPAGGAWVGLFGAAHVPTHADTLATYQAIELAGGAGYSRQQLSRLSTGWLIQGAPGGAQATPTSLSWVFSGVRNIYGYFLVDSAQQYALWAEQFAGPFPIGSAGGVFVLNLPTTLTSQP
jgi:hypothetical protein